MKVLQSLIIFCVLLLSACENAHHNELDRIDRLSETDADSAAMALAKIIPSDLSEADRQYYNLLKVKTDDKKYIQHTSDSLIMSVIDYYENGRDKGKYIQSLFYGGRVTGDLGDIPTSLSLYQQALDQVPVDNNKANIKLRGNILGQMARLFNKTRLYDQAINCLKKTIEIDNTLKDSLNLMYDWELLGHIYLHRKNYDKSCTAYRNSIELAKSKYHENILPGLMYLANLKKYENTTDSAVMLIRGIPESISEDYKSTALAYAAGIYFKANIPDTAAMYAMKLTEYKNDPNLKKAYYILSHPRLRNVVPLDSMFSYIEKYQHETEKYMLSNGDRAILIQNSLYNYKSHEREKDKALRAKNSFIVFTACIALFLAVMTILFLVIKNREQQQRLKLNQSLENIRNLKFAIQKQDVTFNNLKKEYDKVIERQSNSKDFFTQRRKTDYKSIREAIRKECLEIARNSSDKKSVPAEIYNSEIYKKFSTALENNKTIPSESSLWLNLEDKVLEKFPDFKDILDTLAGETLDDYSVHTLLLIKCGFTTKEISALLAKNAQTIYSQRDRLCGKLLGEEIKLKSADFDKIIRAI